MPAGGAKDWVVQTCTQCHDLSPITAAGHNADDWKTIIARMTGGSAPPDQIQEAANYLAGAFPEGLADHHRRAAQANKDVPNYRPVTKDMLRNPPYGTGSIPCTNMKTVFCATTEQWR